MFRPRVVIDRDRSHKIDDDQTKHRPWRSGYRLPTSRAGYISLPFSLLGLGLGLGVLFSVEVGVWRSFWPILMACVCYWRHFRVLAFFKHCSHFKITHTRETNHSSIRLIASISSSCRRVSFCCPECRHLLLQTLPLRFRPSSIPIISHQAGHLAGTSARRAK